MTESTVILGNPKTTIMRHQLRLIHTVDTKGNPVVILTNDFKMSALEISEIYRSRWKIELFFKWVKQHLRVKKFYGQSANAVYSQIWLALITYCLLLLTQFKGEKLFAGNPDYATLLIYSIERRMDLAYNNNMYFGKG